MTDSQLLGFAFFLPVLILALAVILTARVEKQRTDRVAEYKRRIERNGFKSRIGAK